MEGSLRNDDVLVLIEAKVPARLREIAGRKEKLEQELDELRSEEYRLGLVNAALQTA